MSEQGHDQPIDNASVADSRSEEQIEKDKELAERLSSIIEDANNRVIPLCKMIRKVSSPKFDMWISLKHRHVIAAHRGHGSSP